jgi:hypothetical protein
MILIDSAMNSFFFSFFSFSSLQGNSAGNQKLRLLLQHPEKEKLMRSIWKKYDKDGSYALDRQEFQKYFIDLLKSVTPKDTHYKDKDKYRGKEKEKDDEICKLSCFLLLLLSFVLVPSVLLAFLSSFSHSPSLLFSVHALNPLVLLAFNLVDVNSDGSISYSEFRSSITDPNFLALLQVHIHEQEESSSCSPSPSSSFLSLPPASPSPFSPLLSSHASSVAYWTAAEPSARELASSSGAFLSIENLTPRHWELGYIRYDSLPVRPGESLFLTFDIVNFRSSYLVLTLKGGRVTTDRQVVGSEDEEAGNGNGGTGIGRREDFYLSSTSSFFSASSLSLSHASPPASPPSSYIASTSGFSSGGSPLSPFSSPTFPLPRLSVLVPKQRLEIPKLGIRQRRCSSYVEHRPFHKQAGEYLLLIEVYDPLTEQRTQAFYTYTFTPSFTQLTTFRPLFSLNSAYSLLDDVEDGEGQKVKGKQAESEGNHGSENGLVHGAPETVVNQTVYFTFFVAGLPKLKSRNRLSQLEEDKVLFEAKVISLLYLSFGCCNLLALCLFPSRFFSFWKVTKRSSRGDHKLQSLFHLPFIPLLPLLLILPLLLLHSSMIST